jgi:O-antigen/teichoic acid export membrane protein
MMGDASEVAGPPLPSAPPLAATPPRGSRPARANLDRTFSSISRGTAVMTVATFSVVLLQFITRVIVIRHISPSQWGEFNLGLSLASLLALLAAFGIPTATARSMAFEETYEARMALVRRALYVSIPVGLASTILVYVFAADLAAPFHSPDLAEVFRLFSVSIGLTMLSNVLVGIFQGLERAEPYALFIQIVNPALFLGLTAVFIFTGWGFTGVLVGFVLSWVGAFALLVVYSSRALPKLLRKLSAATFTGDASARVSFVALSVTLFGVATLTYVTSYADTLLLGVFQSATIVGYYSSAMNLTRLLLVGTGTVTFIYLPISTRLRRQRDFAGLRETYVTVTRWMAMLTLPFSFLFFFDAKFSLIFTFSLAQAGGYQALQILVLANTAAILLGPSVSVLGGLGKTRSVLWFTMISAVSNIGLCIVLIPAYGMLGAAVAWAVARLIFPILSLIQIYRDHQITPFASHFTRPLAVTGIILVPVYLFVLPHPSILLLPLLVLLPLIVFAGAIIATRSVDRGDLHFVRVAERYFSPLRPVRRLLESRLALEPGLAAGDPMEI